MTLTKSIWESIPATDLRLMEIPKNKLGLGEGIWLRLPELEAWLRAQEFDEAADLLIKGVVTEPNIIAEKHTAVRR